MTTFRVRRFLKIVFLAAAFCAMAAAFLFLRGNSPFRQVSGKAPSVPSRTVILLVHGMVVDLRRPATPWGKPKEDPGGEGQWSGMIGYLRRQGLRFGGVISRTSEEVRLPENLDRKGVTGDPTQADFFSLRFSKEGNAEGIAFRALELAQAIERLRNYTGCEKIRLVTHSAGGLVARAYLQGALPDLPFRGDVDRLITIATPHLGNSLPKHFGEFLGTRATSLQSTSEFLTRLNSDLPLPEQVRFVSCVVRVPGTALVDKVSWNEPSIDEEAMKSLPEPFVRGDDQVLTVRSQNLFLTVCARKYEKAGNLAVHHVAAFVPPQSLGLVHSIALDNPEVHEWVHFFLSQPNNFWEKANGEEWDRKQSRTCILGLLEKSVLQRHNLVSLKDMSVSLEALGKESHFGFRFKAEGVWRGNIVGINQGKTRMAGEFVFERDRFGRLQKPEFRNVEVDDDWPLPSNLPKMLKDFPFPK